MNAYVNTYRPSTTDTLHMAALCNCIARNKRRMSAKRYKGLAKVITRRTHKGFAIRYNPDAHWSAALYKGLNSLQYKDGREICNINRDDASGFRLDTLATNKQHATPVVQDHEVLTTRIDLVSIK